MATSDLLNKLRTDITDTYTSINNLGGTIPEHKNTENISSAIESIYNKLPKVSNTGTDLILSPTLEARLGLIPRGNTYQETTTGKAKMDLSLANGESSQTINNVTTTVNDYTIKINGTPSSAGGAYTKYTTLPAGTYKICARYVSGSFTQTETPPPYATIQFIVTDGTNNYASGGFQTNSSTGDYTKTFTLSEDTSVRMRFYFGAATNPTFTNYTFNLQVVSGSNDDFNFEKYTNGASPNSSYPQMPKVVTGENGVKVENRNYLDIEKYFYKASASEINGATITVENGILTVDATNATARATAKSESYYGTDRTIIPAGTYYFGVRTNGFLLNGDTRTWRQIDTGIQTLEYNYEISQWFFPCNAGNTNTTPLLISSDSNKTDYVEHKEQNYPLSLNDIELVEIGNYADYIEGTPDVSYNLFDINEVTTTASTNWGITVNGNVLTIEHKNTYTTGTPLFELTDFPSGTYILTGDFTGNLGFYVNGTWNKNLQSGSTFTINDGEECRITFGNSSVTTITYTNLQIVEGTEAKPYFPYGQVGMWVKKEYVRKIRYNDAGAQGGDFATMKQNGYGCRYFTNDNIAMNSDRTLILSNRFIGKQTSLWNGVNGEGIQIGTTSNAIFIAMALETLQNYYGQEITSSNFRTAWQSYLDNNETYIWYPLAEPTEVPITDTTLINQLNALYYARSYDDETNISTSCEEGNMPMKINASALKGESNA